jgi:beta-lactamase regulating signal transducer with metallopeptidase domain/ketosteroid isomerase-like protein
MLLASSDRLNSAAEALVSAAASHLAQTIILALVLLLIDATLGRRLGPHWRCALWLIFFLKLALPPQLALPSSPVFWLSRAPAPAVVAQPVPAMETMSMTSDLWAATSEPTTVDAGASTPASDATDSVRLNWQLFLLGGWAAGVLGFGAATLVRRRRLHAVLRRGVEAPVALQAALARARAEVGLRRPCSLRLLDTAIGPMVAGLWRPVIYLPRQLASDLDAAQLHGVLVHELLHVKRGDLWVAAVQAVARVVFFYHPAVWWVNAHLARLREEATDRAVLWHREVDVHAYSLALVAAAELGLGARPVDPFALGVIETKSQLGKRIQMNLNQPRPRHARLGRSGLLSLALLGLVLIPMAPAGFAQSAKTPAGFKPGGAAAAIAPIEAASEQIFAAFNRRDHDAYVAAFADDALVLPPGFSLQTGRVGASEAYLQVPPGMSYEAIRWKSRQCYRIGRWIVDTGLAGFQFRLNPGAPIRTDPRQALTLWEEGNDGAWQVKVLAWNPLPQPPDFSTSDEAQVFEFAKAGAPVSRTGDFRAVLEAETAFHRAFEDKRFAEAAAYYADDGILFTPESHPVRGSDAIRRYITGVPPDRPAQRIERSVAHVEGNENHVLVVNLFQWSFTPPGANAPITIAGKGVHLWQRSPDGGWKILFDLPNASQSTDGQG